MSTFAVPQKLSEHPYVPALPADFLAMIGGCIEASKQEEEMDRHKRLRALDRASIERENRIREYRRFLNIIEPLQVLLPLRVREYELQATFDVHGIEHTLSFEDEGEYSVAGWYLGTDAAKVFLCGDGRSILYYVVEGIRMIRQITALMLPDRDYSCGAAYCDDEACNMHGPRDDGELLYWKRRRGEILVPDWYWKPRGEISVPDSIKSMDAR